MRGHFKGRAIILSRRDVGEADRLVRVFFADSGRETVVARGVRKPQAKLRGMLEPGMEVELHCAQSKGLPVVTGASMIAVHEALMTDYQSLVVAQGLLEITEKTIAEQSSEPEWYDFLTAALEHLAHHTHDNCAHQLVWVTALVKNLSSHGLSPVLTLDKRYLRLRDGAFEKSGGVEMSLATIKLWRVCRDYTVGELARIQGVAAPLAELEPVVQQFWSLQTGIDQLKSRSLAGS